MSTLWTWSDMLHAVNVSVPLKPFITVYKFRSGSSNHERDGWNRAVNIKLQILIDEINIRLQFNPINVLKSQKKTVGLVVWTSARRKFSNLPAVNHRWACFTRVDHGLITYMFNYLIVGFKAGIETRITVWNKSATKLSVIRSIRQECKFGMPR